jgi:hypothetical protein
MSRICCVITGLVEQYFMSNRRVYVVGSTTMICTGPQIDLETTALDLVRGRIFLATVRDSHGLAAVLEAPAAADEPRPIRDLLVLLRKRDPDVLENPNLFGFDLPFLEARAAAHRIPLGCCSATTSRPWGPVSRRSCSAVAGRELWIPGMGGILCIARRLGRGAGARVGRRGRR